MIQWMPTATDIRAAQTSLSGLLKKGGGVERKGIDDSQEVRGRNGYVYDDKNTLYAYIKSQRIIKKLPWMKLFHYYNTYQKHDKNLFYQSPGLFFNMSVFYNYPQ